MITFSSTVPQVAGRQYAITVDYPEAPPAGYGQFQGVWMGSALVSYAGGALVSSADGDTWEPNAGGDYDVHFETFVKPD
jgi:hypothetical protein